MVSSSSKGSIICFLPLLRFFMTIPTQTSTCCEFWRAMATKFVDRLSEIVTWVLLNRLWSMRDLEQSHLTRYSFKLAGPFEGVLEGKCRHFNAGRAINRLYGAWFTAYNDQATSPTYRTRSNLSLFISMMPSLHIVSRLPSSSRGLSFLVCMRKQKSKCRLCRVRVELMPGAEPGDCLAQHFIEVHWNA
ncbi:hypothetical protein T440DRAFT_78018 [Plenodomus tracheiphilus IPT5]|uniref:C2H2-type domain-containing protein n=1 Tax=Plenodomus tracheiphilus IPT5 TaxID=1408161 RepID=A0A6A7B674_9PLEO|nr:hypothetical protein T440DRAFT_78018 [Plenodomus tracheiphilus IPT5]